MKDSDHWPENGDTDEDPETEEEMPSLDRFGFGEDWEELPTQDHEPLTRKARRVGRKPKKGATRFDLPEDYGDDELDELDWAASQAQSKRRGARPRTRRKGASKNPDEQRRAHEERPGKSDRVFLAPRPGPRR